MTKKITIFKKHSNFINILFKKLVAILFKSLNINKYTINLKPSKQLFYKPIYNLKSVKLKSLKTYIKTNLINKFIHFLKLFTKIHIF